MMEETRQVEDIQNYAQNIVDTVREPLLILDATLRVRSANRAFYQTFHVSSAETEGRLIYELGNGQWDIPALRTLLEDIVPKSSVFDDFELEHIFPVIGRRIMLLNARKLQAGHHGELLVLAMEDVTARRLAEEALLKGSALQNAIFNSANFSSIATDEKGVIQIFNVGAERMLGYAASDVMNKITPADISDPVEVIARAEALSTELGNTITPGFEALVFKASRGIEDIYELTYIRQDGSRFPAIVSVTALRDAHEAIIGYLLIGTDNTARKLVEAERQHLIEAQEETNRQLQQANVTLRDSEEKLAVTLNSIGDAVIATDAKARVTLLNPLAEQLTGWTQAQAAGRFVDEIFHIINKETRELGTIPVMETLLKGTVQGLANHTVLIARDQSECDIADSCAPIRDREGQVVGAVLVFRDVTGEYAAQQALRDSSALIQTILNTVVDGIITLRARNGTIETVNPAAERMFGYTAAELIGQNFSLLIPELSQDQQSGSGSLEYYSPSDEARANGLGREVFGRRKNESLFPMEMAVSEMWLGGQRYFTGILRDITARKQAEDAILEAGALQSAIFNSANFSSIATDEKGVIQIFNIGAERMLGYTAAEVLNKITPADISDPQEVITRAKALSTELSTPITPGFEALVFKASRGIEDIYELTYIRKDGSRFPAIVSVTALRNDQNGIIGFLLIGTDNTARKQIEAERMLLDQRVRDQQFYTRSLIESNIDALITTDPRGIITDVNKQMEALTGCTRDELIGAPFKGYFTNPERAEAGIKLVLAEGKVTDYELTARARDGQETVVSYNATTFHDRDRKLQGVFAAARDVTERSRFEVQMREQAATLSELHHRKDEFLAMLSHELRSPLAPIFNAVQLLGLERDNETVIQHQARSIIERQMGQLQHLVDDLLEVSRITTGRVQLRRERVGIHRIVEGAVQTAQPLIEQFQHHLTVTVPPETIWLFADAARLEQVVVNLLTNAAKYTSAGGNIWLTVQLEGDRCELRVRDTGVGISPALLPLVFDLFTQAERSLDRSQGGLGIGLALVQQLTELHEGTVEATSVLGQGSEFVLRLPVLSSENPPPLSLAVETSPAATRPLRVLVVDDNVDTVLSFSLLLKAFGHEVWTAHDGPTALQAALDCRPDLVVLDIGLPGLNGYEVAKRIRSNSTLQNVVLVALTGYGQDSDRQISRQAGFNHHLVKPADLAQVQQILATITTSSQSAS